MIKSLTHWTWKLGISSDFVHGQFLKTTRNFNKSNNNDTFLKLRVVVKSDIK